MQSLNYEMSNHFTFVKKLSGLHELHEFAGEGLKKICADCGTSVRSKKVTQEDVLPLTPYVREQQEYFYAVCLVIAEQFQENWQYS